jgi:hypothetical protein
MQNDLLKELSGLGIGAGTEPEPLEDLDESTLISLELEPPTDINERLLELIEQAGLIAEAVRDLNEISGTLVEEISKIKYLMERRSV